jgi:hypothetical protein
MQCCCVRDPETILMEDVRREESVDGSCFAEFCSCTDEPHRREVWKHCFPEGCLASSKLSTTDPALPPPEPADAVAERLAQYMLGINPSCAGGDVQDWERGDESETMVHNMVSTSVVNGSEMPINLSQLGMLLPCSTYDRKRFAAITIRIDNPRCTALLFTSGKLVITGVKSWYDECLYGVSDQET